MIDVKDLGFSYRGSKHQVFSHFDLQLEQGRIYGLLGKNGTGKSPCFISFQDFSCPTWAACR